MRDGDGGVFVHHHFSLPPGMDCRVVRYPLMKGRSVFKIKSLHQIALSFQLTLDPHRFERLSSYLAISVFI